MTIKKIPNYLPENADCQRENEKFVLDLYQFIVVRFDSFQKFILIYSEMMKIVPKTLRGLAAAIAMPMLFAAVNAQKADKDIAVLSKWMTGSFDTFDQVNADEEADAKYRHIRAILHVLPITISELAGGASFYVENQAAESRTKPYRQRVYHLSRDTGGKIVLSIYKISRPEELINAHKNPEVLRKVVFSRLSKEEGCDLIHERAEKDLFKGKVADAAACKSTLRGATRTYSESEITPTQWTNLDQGFDDAGNHKWGPPPGTVGHIFAKRSK